MPALKVRLKPRENVENDAEKLVGVSDDARRAIRRKPEDFSWCEWLPTRIAAARIRRTNIRADVWRVGCRISDPAKRT